MSEQEMSPKAKVTYDQHKFEVEFNVTDYLPEVIIYLYCIFNFNWKYCKVATKKMIKKSLILFYQ